MTKYRVLRPLTNCDTMKRNKQVGLPATRTPQSERRVRYVGTPISTPQRLMLDSRAPADDAAGKRHCHRGSMRKRIDFPARGDTQTRTHLAYSLRSIGTCESNIANPQCGSGTTSATSSGEHAGPTNPCNKMQQAYQIEAMQYPSRRIGQHSQNCQQRTLGKHEVRGYRAQGETNAGSPSRGTRATRAT